MFLPGNRAGEEVEAEEERGGRWRRLASIAGQSTIHACLRPVLTAIGLVMAGTGDLDALRILRFVGGRLDFYGTHMAAHQALGLLFLGVGRYTLRTEPKSIAALLVAFYPRYPSDAGDNRDHLQLFRHLYTLAAEPRVLLPTHAATIVPAQLTLTAAPSPHYAETSAHTTAPLVLPELHTLSSITFTDPRYWSLSFRSHVPAEWDELRRILNGDGRLRLQLRTGFFSRLDDPSGVKSESAVVRLGREALRVPFPKESGGKGVGGEAAAAAALAHSLQLSPLAPLLLHLHRACNAPGVNVGAEHVWDVQCLIAFSHKLSTLRPHLSQHCVLQPELLRSLQVGLFTKLGKDVAETGVLGRVLKDLWDGEEDGSGSRADQLLVNLLQLPHFHAIKEELSLEKLSEGLIPIHKFCWISLLRL